MSNHNETYFCEFVITAIDSKKYFKYYFDQIILG